jgi:hypothetical protein
MLKVFIRDWILRKTLEIVEDQCLHHLLMAVQQKRNLTFRGQA